MSFEKLMLKIAEDVFENINGQNEGVKEIVGKVSFETLKMHQSFVDSKNDLLEDISDRKMELDLQSKRRIKQEFSERTELIKDEHNKIWDKIFDELDIKDRTISYSIDVKTGEVTMNKVPKKNPKEQLKVVKCEIDK